MSNSKVDMSTLLSFLDPPPTPEAAPPSQELIAKIAQYEGMDSGLCWRCGHQTNGDNCHFCGRSFEEQFEDFEDFDNPAGPDPWESDPDDTAIAAPSAAPKLQKASSKAKKKNLPVEESDDEGDIIAPRKRRNHVKQREALVQIAYKILQDEKDRVNLGRDDALANFMLREDPADPFSEARLPEFRPYEATVEYMIAQAPPAAPPSPTIVTPYHPKLTMPTPLAPVGGKKAS
ncbi:hypothetical protein F4775DRAFT_553085 [Biscogniauxia sp. FL1348]|nr:hypothetical protein F4775DRAFT_553085 [Biscogniauxia sp. FL1348]